MMVRREDRKVESWATSRPTRGQATKPYTMLAMRMPGWMSRTHFQQFNYAHSCSEPHLTHLGLWESNGRIRWWWQGWSSRPGCCSGSTPWQSQVYEWGFYQNIKSDHINIITILLHHMLKGKNLLSRVGWDPSLNSWEEKAYWISIAWRNAIGSCLEQKGPSEGIIHLHAGAVQIHTAKWKSANIHLHVAATQIHFFTFMELLLKLKHLPPGHTLPLLLICYLWCIFVTLIILTFLIIFFAINVKHHWLSQCSWYETWLSSQSSSTKFLCTRFTPDGGHNHSLDDNGMMDLYDRSVFVFFCVSQRGGRWGLGVQHTLVGANICWRIWHMSYMMRTPLVKTSQECETALTSQY